MSHSEDAKAKLKLREKETKLSFIMFAFAGAFQLHFLIKRMKFAENLVLHFISSYMTVSEPSERLINYRRLKLQHRHEYSSKRQFNLYHIKQ